MKLAEAQQLAEHAKRNPKFESTEAFQTVVEGKWMMLARLKITGEPVSFYSKEGYISWMVHEFKARGLSPHED